MPWPAASGPDELAIADRGAITLEHPMARGIDLDHTLSQVDVDGAGAPKGLRSQQHSLEGLLAAQIVLGERWSLVRQIDLIADHADAAGELLLSQCDRGIGASVAGPDNQHIVVWVLTHTPF